MGIETNRRNETGWWGGLAEKRAQCSGEPGEDRNLGTGAQDKGRGGQPGGETLCQQRSFWGRLQVREMSQHPGETEV